jgi:hypothetical protein
MQNHYSINVSRNKHHFFATRPESLTTKNTAADVFDELSHRFPEREGFLVTITYWQGIGSDVTAEFKAIIESPNPQF